MSDGHSMFKPLKQDSVKHVALSMATGVKSKVRTFPLFLSPLPAAQCS